MTKSTTKILAAILILASVAMVFLDWLDAYVIGITFIDFLKMALDSGLSDINAVLLLIVAILLAVTAIIGFICAITGKKVGPILYLIAAILALAYFIYASSETGAGLAIGAFLCPALALVAVVCICLPAKE